MNYLKETVVYKLMMAQKNIISSVKKEFKDIDITIDNYITLHFIYENPGITQVELARINDKDTNVIVKTIDRLEKNNLVKRKNGLDRRSYTLYVTDDGKKVINKYWKKLITRQEECLSKLTTDEKATLIRLLELI